MDEKSSGEIGIDTIPSSSDADSARLVSACESLNLKLDVAVEGGLITLRCGWLDLCDLCDLKTVQRSQPNGSLWADLRVDTQAGPGGRMVAPKLCVLSAFG